MIAIKKILAPTDCSEPSSDALFYATGIAKNFNADLIVLKVFSSPVETIQDGMVIRDYDLDKKRPEQVQEIEEFWNRFAESGIKPEFVNLLGDPFNEILRYSQEHSIDMIVMGTHGYTGFKHIFMGSVAEKVVRYSFIPVLTVKQKDFEYRQADNILYR